MKNKIFVTTLIASIVGSITGIILYKNRRKYIKITREEDMFEEE